MNEVLILGLAGIAGTLLSPIVAGRAQRANIREDRILDRRLSIYAELLEATQQLHDNAQTWSAVPLAELPEPPSERLRKVDAEVKVVGSDNVREAMRDAARLTIAFQRELFTARLKAARVQRENLGDSPEAIRARMELGGIADELTPVLDKLEAAIRAEMRN